LKLLKSKDEKDSNENMPRGQDNNAHHIGVKVLSKNEPIALDKLTCSQVPRWTQVGSKSVKQWNCLKLGARSQLSTLKGVEGRAEAPGWK